MTQKDIEEIEVERDFVIRKRIMSIFNKQSHSFPDMDMYRDYEEMVEDIIYNLANNIESDVMNQKVIDYQKENMQLIAENQSRLTQENDLIRDDILRDEEYRNSQRCEEMVRIY